MERQDGFFPLHWDGAKGRLLMEVREGKEFLYLTSLATGLGSEALGLDRGMIGAEHLVTSASGRGSGKSHQPAVSRGRRRRSAARSVTEPPTSVAAALDVLAEATGGSS
jgi:hypothetical protein